MKNIGQVQSLFRFPVKSFGGEQLQQVEIQAFGMYGDRSHALINATETGWKRFITARTYPMMLSYTAAMHGEGTAQHYPELLITHKDGSHFHWDDHFLQHIRDTLQQDACMEQYTPEHPGIQAVDASSLLIITDASLRALEQLWNKPLDLLRFRANIILKLDADTPFLEADWIGRQLQIGEGDHAVIVHIDEPCERCTMITIDPHTYERDPSLLKTLFQERGAFFGVYASVVRTGAIHEQDAVYLAE